MMIVAGAALVLGQLLQGAARYAVAPWVNWWPKPSSSTR
jgi:hypothetical protein